MATICFPRIPPCGSPCPDICRTWCSWSWNKETNTLTVSFNEGLTADRWKSIYTGGGKRDFAALYYTFIYIGEGQRPDYWTWVDGSEKAIDAVIAEAGTKANYDPNDRGITNGIYVVRFQNDGEIMALPGNTSYNSTSREIISWKDKSTDYFTNVIDTTGMSNISFTLDEDAGQSYGQGRNWLNELGTPAGNERIDTYTTAEGVTLTVNNGLVTAQLDGTKLLDLEKVLASYVTVTAPEGATEYRMVGNGTSTEPGAADDAGAKWEVTSMKDWLAKKEWSAVPGPIRVTPNTLKEQKIGDVSYYVGNTITGVNCCVFEWKFANGTTKVEYVYFNATPYVHTVQTQSVSEVTSAVDKPTLQSDDAALTLKCRMFPQDNENAHYMRLTVEKGGQTVSGFSGEYTVFVPYEYVGLTWEEAQKRTEPPVIYHYTDAEVLKEELTGEYTQWGICFKTSSFSPFVISTAAQSSSGGGYYYGGASTPGISAVKTADAAKSATDYTSGIYGLTFRSTAAFSGFKGVQVDGRTHRRGQLRRRGQRRHRGLSEGGVSADAEGRQAHGDHSVRRGQRDHELHHRRGGQPHHVRRGHRGLREHGAGVRGRHGLDAEKEALTAPIRRRTASTPASPDRSCGIRQIPPASPGVFF